MRQLYLVNEVGTTYFFDYRSNTLISDISDIGFSKDITYLSFENTYLKADEKNPQTSLVFTVVFLKGYEGYSSFLEFLKVSKGELRFFYKVNDDAKFCYVAVKSLTKTQLESGVITSTLTLDKLSLWIKRDTSTITVNEDKNGKVFPYKYTFTYSASFNGTISVRNDGEVKAPLNITIVGAVDNPILEVIKNGVVISKLRLLVKSTSCVIDVSAEVTNQYILMTENGVASNIYSKQDFTCDNFLFLEPGEFQLKFSPGVSSKTTCKVTIMEGYSGH